MSKSLRLALVLLSLFCPGAWSPAFSSENPRLIDELSCQSTIYGELRNGKPKYWAQMMMRPRNVSLFLSEAERKQPAIVGNSENRVDFEHKDLARLLLPYSRIRRMGDVLEHGSETTAAMCSRGRCGMLNENVQVFASEVSWLGLFHENSWMRYLDRVRAYNKTVPIAQRVRVVNFSFRMFRGRVPNAEELKKLAQIEKENEITIVTSSGNEGDKIDYQAPESLVVANALLDSGHGLTAYSNYGHRQALSAPVGQDFTSISGRPIGGTSFAAPQIAGALAYLQKVNPLLSARSQRAIVKATASLPPFLSPRSVPHPFVGYGKPNVVLATNVARQVDTKILNAFASEKEAIEYVRKTQRKVQRDFHLRLVRVYPKGVTPQRYVTHQAMKQAADCQEYGRQFDRLLYQNFMMGETTFGRWELCKVAQAQKSSWGIRAYCSLTQLMRSVGKPDPTQVLRDASLFRLIANDAFEKKYFDEKGKELVPLEVASQYSPYLTVRAYLTSARVKKRFPKLWAQKIDYFLGSPDRMAIVMDGPIVKILLQDVLSQPAHFDHPKFKRWLDQAAQKYPEHFALYLLDSPLFTHEPALWKKLTVSFMAKHPVLAAKHLLSAELVASRLGKKEWLEQCDRLYADATYKTFHTHILRQKFAATLDPNWERRVAELIQLRNDQKSLPKGVEVISVPDLAVDLLRQEWFMAQFPKDFDRALLKLVKDDPDEAKRLLRDFQHLHEHPSILKYLDIMDREVKDEPMASPYFKPVFNHRLRDLNPKQWNAWMDRVFSVPEKKPRKKDDLLSLYLDLELTPLIRQYSIQDGPPHIEDIFLHPDVRKHDHYPRWVKAGFKKYRDLFTSRLLGDARIRDDFKKDWGEWLEDGGPETVEGVLSRPEFQTNGRWWRERVEKLGDESAHHELSEFLFTQRYFYQEHSDLWFQKAMQVANHEHGAWALAIHVLDNRGPWDERPGDMTRITSAVVRTLQRSYRKKIEDAETPRDRERYAKQWKEKVQSLAQLLAFPRLLAHDPNGWSEAVFWLLPKHPIETMSAIAQHDLAIVPSRTLWRVIRYLRRQPKTQAILRYLLVKDSFVRTYPKDWVAMMEELIKESPSVCLSILYRSRAAKFSPDFLRLRQLAFKSLEEEIRRLRKALNAEVFPESRAPKK